MTLAIGHFLTVWTILALNIMTPGPNVLNTITTAMGSGRAAGLGSALGVGLGIGLWCLGMALGMAALFSLFPMARTVLTVVAVAILCGFALRYLRQSLAGFRDRRLGLPPGREGMSVASGFWRSLSVNALNPKALTTWLAILTIFPVARAHAGDIAILCAGACLLSLAIHSAYALAFSTRVAARAYLRAAPAINGLVAIFFLAFAAKLLAGLAR
ncbi:MAG: LysE family translocator [Paracoccaceae bacterium]